MAEEVTLKNGKKVVIRDLKQNEDVFELCRFVNETRRKSRYLSGLPNLTPEGETKWLQENLEKVKKRGAVFSVAEHNGRIIGICSIESKEFPQAHTAEYGIMIRPGWQGAGLGKLMTKKVVEDGKKNKKFEQIFLRVFSNNKRAIPLYKKAGFKTISRLPGFYKRGKERCDQLHMVLKK